MNVWISANWMKGLTPLLAEAESYRHLGRRFQADAPPLETEELIWAAAFVILPMLLLVLLKLVQRMRRRFQLYSGEALFLELCREHELDWRSRMQLWRLVRQWEISPPAAVFLSSDRLSHALKDNERSPTEREDIRRLFLAIFGEAAI